MHYAAPCLTQWFGLRHRNPVYVFFNPLCFLATGVLSVQEETVSKASPEHNHRSVWMTTWTNCLMKLKKSFSAAIQHDLKLGPSQATLQKETRGKRIIQTGRPATLDSNDATSVSLFTDVVVVVDAHLPPRFEMTSF